jgi:hypothetical protein
MCHRIKYTKQKILYLLSSFIADKGMNKYKLNTVYSLFYEVNIIYHAWGRLKISFGGMCYF